MQCRRPHLNLSLAVLSITLSGCAITGIGNEVVDGKMRFVVVEASGGG